MKIKSYLLTALFAVTLISCSKDDANTTDTASEKEVLNFNSEKAMQDKIAEITSFKKEQEAQIMTQLLERNHLKVPSENNMKSNINAEIDKKAFLEDVKFYHTERLKAIYAERAHFNFTSIQSIADEINSLKLLNPTKATNLSNKYDSLLTKGKYETASVFNKSVASLTNDKGELFLNGRNIAEEELLEENSSSNSPIMVSGGHLATGYNGFIVVTYAADVEFDSYIGVTYTKPVTGADGTVTNVDVYGSILTYRPSTTLTCFVNSSVGYVLYPCYFYTKPNSLAKFNISCDLQYVNFGVGVGSSTKMPGQARVYIDSPNCETMISGYVSGNYAIPSGSTFLWVSGTKTF